MTDEPMRGMTTPLIVVVSRRVRKGQEAKFEKLSNQMTEKTAPKIQDDHCQLAGLLPSG
tara:strand:+ start:24763 stop:24939 length:177 start_codon:yes stop_codon:yes gene_type:complete